MQIESISPILVTSGPDEENDCANIYVQLYNRDSIESIRKLMEEVYKIKAEDSEKLPENKERMQFVGSGCWFKSRSKDGSLRVSVDVGCYCTHDCCGHLCGLEHTFQLSGSYIVVITKRTYNH